MKGGGEVTRIQDWKGEWGRGTDRAPWAKWVQRLIDRDSIAALHDSWLVRSFLPVLVSSSPARGPFVDGHSEDPEDGLALIAALTSWPAAISTGEWERCQEPT